MTSVLSLILLGMIGLPQWLVIALIVLLLFGGRKIPELMRGLGKGVREFRDGLNDASGKTTTDDSAKTDKRES